MGDKGPAGGLVFYDKGDYSDGWRYLECAPNDQSGIFGARWHNGNFAAIADFAKKVYQTNDLGWGVEKSGKETSDRIVAFFGKGDYAASLCRNLNLGGKSDWYLPGSGEMRILSELGVNQPQMVNLNGDYWTSTVSSAYGDIAYFRFNRSGFSDMTRNDVAMKVRAVRRF